MQIENQYTFKMQAQQVPRQRNCGFCRQGGHTIGFCSTEQAHGLYERLSRSADIIRQYPYTTIEQQAVRFKSHLTNNYSAIELKLLALRFFNYRGTQHNILAHATFIVDSVFDPEERRPFQAEADSMATLQRIAYENVSRRRDIRSQRENFQRETQRYNALRQSYQENVDAYNQHLRTNSSVEIAAIRQHAPYLPNGTEIVDRLNDGLARAGNDPERHSVIGTSMQEVLAGITERERQMARAEAQRSAAEGEQARLRNLQNQREMRKIATTILCTETAAQLQRHQDCPICYSDETKLIDMITTNCNHEFCKTCICRHIDGAPTNRRACCPMCRADIRSLVVKDLEFCEELNRKYNVV